MDYIVVATSLPSSSGLHWGQWVVSVVCSGQCAGRAQVGQLTLASDVVYQMARRRWNGFKNLTFIKPYANRHVNSKFTAEANVLSCIK